MKKEEENTGLKAALDKMRRYCTWQERCHNDIELKFLSLHLSEDEKAEIISRLISEDFLNEERFALCFARSKHNQNGWGKIKIRAGLKVRNIPQKLIEKAIAGIENDIYIKNFHKLANQKLKETGKLNTQAEKAKLYNYLKTKGYESELILPYIQ